MSINIRRTWVTALLAAVVVSLALHAAATPAKEPAPERTDEATKPPAPEPAPAPAATSPAPEPEPAPRQGPKRFVFPEGTRLVDRVGRIVSYEMDVLGAPKPKAWHRSAFVTSADDHVFILLENQELHRLEDATRRGEIEVRLSGTITRYRDRNYLLITRAEQREVERAEEPW